MVVRAIDTHDGRAVAVKVLEPSYSDARIDRELDLIQRLDIPGVVRYRDVGALSDGSPYLVSEWIDGRTLQHVLAEDGPLPIERAHDLFEQLCLILDSVHAAGVIHRDVTARNVMVSDDDVVTVIDFGLSRGDESTTITNADELSGTPRYLAPEVIEGEPSTEQSDQYSAALLFYEMVAGTWPFGEGGTVATALHHQLHSSPTPLSELVPSVPDTIDDALGHALAKDPGHRYASMVGLAAALRGVSDGDELPAAWAHGAPAPARDRGISPLVVVGVGLVLAVGAAVAAYVVSLPDAAGTDPDTAAADAPGGGEVIEADADSDAEAATSAASSAAALPAPAEPGGISDFPVSAGTAGGLDCNLLAQPDFESGAIEFNWYRDEENPDRERVVGFGGVDNSAVLTVGEADGYGLYGEFVEILPGQVYVFGGWAERSGAVVDASFDVIWLDEAFDPLTEVNAPVAVAADGAGWYAHTTESAPPEARWAVPKIYKDGSPGVLLVDELVFGPVESACATVLGR